ncbi:MAG: serine hydrolase [Cyclobacteriaceae bacterium]|nr:serine hydrolase [Cyclobacteriaceae bacterium]
MKKTTALSILILVLSYFQSYSQNAHVEKLKENTLQKLDYLHKNHPGVFGYYVVHLESGEIFSHQKDLVFAQASAIKIPILVQVVKQSMLGGETLEDEVKISSDQKVGGSGVISSLKNPVVLSIYDLCVLMMKYSDNTATNILINRVGMAGINKTMQELGVGDIKLQRLMMDTESSRKGLENIASPESAAKLMQLLASGKAVNREVSEKVLEIMKVTTDIEGRLKKQLPDDAVVLFKPGMIPGVSTEWAVIKMQNQHVAMAVMESMLPENDRGNYMEAFGKIIYDYFNMKISASPYGAFFR